MFVHCVTEVCNHIAVHMQTYRGVHVQGHSDAYTPSHNGVLHTGLEGWITRGK